MILRSEFPMVKAKLALGIYDLSDLTDLQSKVLVPMLDEGKRQIELARELGITQGAMSRLIARAIYALKNGAEQREESALRLAK